MPNLPQPLQMRDWRKVTTDYLNLILDENRQGRHLPLLTWSDGGRRIHIPSYVGGPDGSEAINVLAAVVSGGLVGIDMQRFRGHDWVSICTNYFSAAHGVCGNGWGGGSGATFWYDLFPNVLFYQICALNPVELGRDKILISIADRWYQGCLALGANTNGALPNFDHLSFNLETMKPVDNGRWLEPEGAAGVAWCEYMAWTRFRDPRYLQAADWALRSLLERRTERSPQYEVLLPYAALTAARMNAELGRNYDVAKLLTWCFEPMSAPAARHWWGVLTERFGELDCYGLVGSSKDTDGYAFAMNTFQWPGALAPLARYDAKYARSMGKWILNLANASRLFYANGLPADHQDHRDWADQYDPAYCVAYEGLRRHPQREARPQPYATGDVHVSNTNALNFCLYGSSHVGILGGLLTPTSDPAILKIDLLRTDYFHRKAYPTFLFYNPYSHPCRFEVDFGPAPCDLYELCAERILDRGVHGLTTLKLPADSARILVVLPVGASLLRSEGTISAGGTMVGWRRRS